MDTDVAGHSVVCVCASCIMHYRCPEYLRRNGVSDDVAEKNVEDQRLCIVFT